MRHTNWLARGSQRPARRRSSLALGLAGLAAVAAQPVSKLVWQQNEQYAVYTSAGLSRHKGMSPTFATATWLNSPIMVEVFNVSDNGGNIWSYSSTSTGLPTFQVDMARHADSFGVGNIDTVAAEAQFVPPSTCQVFAWSSLAASATPAWFVNVSNCDANLLYDDDRNIDISDDGSTVAFSAFLIQGKSMIPQLWVLDGQTGKVRYTKNLGATGEGGPVQLSENGTWVAWTTGDSVMVIDGKTGAVRDTVSMGWNCQAELSDSGDFLAFAGEDKGSIYTWNAANSQYTLTYSPVPPGGGTWYATSAAISSDGTGTAEAELATFGYITETALGARVIIYSMVTGALLTDYVSPLNAQLQTYPTVRMSGNYAGVCLWGDNDDVPTAIVLSATSAAPIFTYTTPGSMFGVDIVHDVGASTPTSDRVYFAVGGKHTAVSLPAARGQRR